MSVFVRALVATLVLVNISRADVKDHLVGVKRSVVLLSFPPRLKTVEGSGICIDQNCAIVATTYHAQMLVGRANLGVIGGQTKKVLSLTNESDIDKSDVPVMADKSTLRLNLAHDLSFVYANKPISHKSGAPYSYKFHVGQKVEVAGYYHNKFQTMGATIIGSNVPVMINGNSTLNEDLVLDAPLFPGASGSAVLDEQGNLLGMVLLTGASQDGSVKLSVALPVIAMAKVLSQLDPMLARTIYGEIPQEEPPVIATPSVMAEDNDIADDAEASLTPVVAAVPTDVPHAITHLKETAGAASRMMDNLVAKQCVVQSFQAPVCHEVAVVDGQQIYRKVSGGGESDEPATHFPVHRGVWGDSEWAGSMNDIADGSWLFQGSADDRYLFAFKANAEDQRCYFEEYPQAIPLFGPRYETWKGSVGCFEQVSTDKNFDVLSIFTERVPPDSCLTQVHQTVVYYDWVKIEGVEAPLLLPVRETIIAKIQGQKNWMSAKVTWTDYRKFRAEHRIKW